MSEDSKTENSVGLLIINESADKDVKDLPENKVHINCIEIAVDSALLKYDLSKKIHI